MNINEYAVDMIASGGRSTAEDDMNEDGDINPDDHEEACELAVAISHVLQDHIDELVFWARP